MIQGWIFITRVALVSWDVNAESVTKIRVFSDLNCTLESEHFVPSDLGERKVTAVCFQTQEDLQTIDWHIGEFCRHEYKTLVSVMILKLFIWSCYYAKNTRESSHTWVCGLSQSCSTLKWGTFLLIRFITHNLRIHTIWLVLGVFL